MEEGLAPNARVRISGLKKRPELNGVEGTLVRYMQNRGRWAVQVPGEEKPVQVLPECLASLAGEPLQVKAPADASAEPTDGSESSSEETASSPNEASSAKKAADAAAEVAEASVTGKEAEEAAAKEAELAAKLAEEEAAVGAAAKRAAEELAAATKKQAAEAAAQRAVAEAQQAAAKREQKAAAMEKAAVADAAAFARVASREALLMKLAAAPKPWINFGAIFEGLLKAFKLDGCCREKPLPEHLLFPPHIGETPLTTSRLY